ncbi:Uncharacterized conserved protein, DUF885 familyt [Allosphingosinicella indica]|uniref:Uncharacterized conserved protein, DUF885 familyt n=2 Tax=Allosphingosinicella indica TaxID=941907 RepID=A0A1X7FYS3_9SPHN|nr:Uncharacterized conserved protein, DUF885 familyt [Allosphingosinicella indica]
MRDDAATSRLADLAERYWDFEREETPFGAILAGQPVAGDAVLRESAADHERRIVRARLLLAQVLGISGEDLASQDRATLKLLERELTAVIDLHAADLHLRPWLLPGGPEFNIAFFANSTVLSDAGAAHRYVRRLASLAAAVDDLADNLRAGHAKGIRFPAVVLKAAAASAAAAAAADPAQSAYHGPFVRAAASGPSLEAAAAEGLRVIKDRLLPALGRYAALLAGPLSQGARENLSCVDAPGGANFYRTMVRYFTTTDQGPDEIHQLGLAEVARIEKALAEIAAASGQSVSDYRAALVADRSFISPSSDALLDSIRALCKRIDGLIPTWFGRVPRATYGVAAIPAASSSALPPAYAQPGPADGSAPGMFWVSGLPDKCPSFMHPALAVHEAWPGHLMHIALLQELDTLPAFRRYGAVKYTACIEGWALYCEGLADEMGLYASPAEQFGRLQMELWRALRLVVDTGIHWYDWSRETAIDYMDSRLALSRDTIAAEVDRYAAMPGQALGYQVGNLKMRALRARAEQELGDAFRHRDFHEAVMTAGAVTLPLLDDLVQDWIDQSRAAA